MFQLINSCFSILSVCYVVICFPDFLYYGVCLERTTNLCIMPLLQPVYIHLELLNVVNPPKFIGDSHDIRHTNQTHNIAKVLGSNKAEIVGLLAYLLGREEVPVSFLSFLGEVVGRFAYLGVKEDVALEAV